MGAYLDGLRKCEPLEREQYYSAQSALIQFERDNGLDPLGPDAAIRCRDRGMEYERLALVQFTTWQEWQETRRYIREELKA